MGYRSLQVVALIDHRNPKSAALIRDVINKTADAVAPGGLLDGSGEVSVRMVSAAQTVLLTDAEELAYIVARHVTAGVVFGYWNNSTSVYTNCPEVEQSLLAELQKAGEEGALQERHRYHDGCILQPGVGVGISPGLVNIHYVDEG